MLLQTSDVQIKQLSNEDGVGIFEFSPLPSGFGRTLGNSLRRILLTSLQGGAVTEIRVPKINHQFTTIPGVKEDVVDICLNLKSVRAKVHSDIPVIGTISKKGKGPVTVADIEVPADVELVNKDLYICELADDSTKLEMHVTFEAGYGYVGAGEREISKIGVIGVDALFSPILQMSYDVEETRHNETTGLDKLTIRVTTDGTIDPEDAVKQASGLLSKFFGRFSDGVDEVEEVEAEEETDSVESSKEFEDVFIEDLSLPTRTINALKKHGIEKLSKLAKLNDEEIADIKNLGEKSVVEIKKILETEGLR